MGEFVIFNDIPWKPPLVSKEKFFTIPELKMNLRFPDDKLKDMPKKQRDIFDAEFKKNFDNKFYPLSNKCFAKLQTYIDGAEKKIKAETGKITKSILDGFAKMANGVLEEGCKIWVKEITALCEDAFAKSIEASEKAMKLKITKAKAKAIAKIVVIAAIILTVAAISIAASVVTMGAAPVAAVVLGAIVTGVTALKTTADKGKKNWANVTNGIKQVEADVKNLQKSLEAFKKLKESGGAADKLKSAVAAAKTSIGDLDKDVGKLDKWIFELRETVNKQGAELKTLTASAAKANNAKLTADIKKAEEKVKKTNDVLAQVAKIQQEAEKIKADFAAAKPPQLSNLLKATGFIVTNGKTLLTELWDSVIGIAASAKQIQG